MLDQVILGFDYSYRRLGVAVAQVSVDMVTPLKTFSIKNNQVPWDKIQQLVKHWNASALVVGLPLSPSGREQKTSISVRAFVAQLKKHTGLPVHTVDERYTTVEARSILFEQGGYRKLQRADIDSLAAKLILEQWLRES